MTWQEASAAGLAKQAGGASHAEGSRSFYKKTAWENIKLPAASPVFAVLSLHTSVFSKFPTEFSIDVYI